jgi:hypothetical protein
MVNHRVQAKRRTLPWSLLLVALLGSWGWAGMGWGRPAPDGKPQAQAKGASGSAQKAAAPAKAQRAAAPRSKAAGGGQPAPAPKQAPAAVAGRRDPFKLPAPVSAAGPAGAAETAGGTMPPGSRGLVISQLILEGIVRQDTTNKMIAVVTNYTKRAYFLRENDALFNGVVSKITPDSVYFNENYLDPNGRVGTREVVKRLGAAPGEGR